MSDASQALADRPAAPCPNCGTSLALAVPPRYCPHCGQPTTLLPDWRATARESIDRYARTMRLLVTRPGRLSRDYVAGRRQRYVPPLRLYLALSFVFFLAVKGLGLAGPAHIVVSPGIDRHGNVITPTSDPDEYRDTVAEMQRCVDHDGSCSWYRTWGSRLGLRAVAQAEHADAVSQRFVAMAPNAVFVLLPVFAALTMLAYRSRRLNYGAHLVFSLHLHSFWFLCLLLLALLPDDGASLLALLLPFGYGVWALQAMHRGRWWATLVRVLFVAGAYSIALLLTMAGLGIASILAA